MKPRSGPITIDFAKIRDTEELIMRATKSRNTQIAYASGWKLFNEWCAVAKRKALPASAQTLQDFASWSINQGYRLQTIALRLSAISHYHCEAGLRRQPNVKLRTYMNNARRALREDPAGKRAVTYDMLSRMVLTFPETPCGIRNRAMILLSFASGWRRSEIVALRFRDIKFVTQGLELWLRASKTDQEGQGRLVGIAPGTKPETCPIRALQAWLAVRGFWEGPLFVRTTPAKLITRVGLEPRGEVIKGALKDAVSRIGADATYFGAHSLRSGMITEASKHGASESSIMQRTGHRCIKTLQKYIRPATAFEFNPLRDVL